MLTYRQYGGKCYKHSEQDITNKAARNANQ